MVKEIEADAKQLRRSAPHADPGREEGGRPRSRVVDEPVTVVVSQKGWVRRARAMATRRRASPSRRATACTATSSAARSDTLLAFGSNGRVYSVPVSTLPGARGDGQPLTTLVELESGTHLVHYFAGAGTAWLLLSNSGGYGFLATVDNMVSRQKGGKAFLSLGAGETVCRPSPANVPPPPGAPATAATTPATHVCCASSASASSPSRSPS
jgi:topoisomerase-4 subunit A